LREVTITVPAARAGFFPLGEGRWSEGLVREAVWPSGQAPFEHVEAIL
jgi:hypothetical protein